MSNIQIDRRAFITKLGGAAVVATLSADTLADALEEKMSEELDKQAAEVLSNRDDSVGFVRRGVGSIFKTQGALPVMPAKPTIFDFFKLRFAPATHVLQSADHALKTGQPERVVFACLMHDVTMSLSMADHGYWGAQLLAPYVDERVSWAIRQHQALRFFPDESVGYEYPELYVKMFGENFKPEPYIYQTYEYARKHKWYMDSRMITVNDTYAFNPDLAVTLDPFIDILGRNFKQPKEGLGYDNSTSAHMWRTLINPDRPL
jgi:hypothetical protein